jgi:hypothetical protein
MLADSPIAVKPDLAPRSLDAGTGKLERGVEGALRYDRFWRGPLTDDTFSQTRSRRDCLEYDAQCVGLVDAVEVMRDADRKLFRSGKVGVVMLMIKPPGSSLGTGREDRCSVERGI